MNKTLLRAVRREYADYFNMFCQRSDIPTPVPAKSFIRVIEMFINYILGWEDPAEIRDSYDGLRDLPRMLGIFIDFCKMKKLAKDSQEKEFLRKFYDLLYSYSHQKFNEFLMIPEIRFLLRKMLEVDYIDTLIAKNETLQEKAEGYKE